MTCSLVSGFAVKRSGPRFGQGGFGLEQAVNVFQRLAHRQCLLHLGKLGELGDELGWIHRAERILIL